MDKRNYLDCKDDYLSCGDDRGYLDCGDDYLSCGDDKTPPVDPIVVPQPPVEPAPPVVDPKEPHKPRKDDDIVYELFYGLIVFISKIFSRFRKLFK